MSSRTQRDEEATMASPPSVPADFPPSSAVAASRGARDHRRRRWTVVVLAVLLVLALAAAGYLLAVARAWEDRAVELEEAATGLGSDLGQVQAELEESRDTLALVESQLDGAQEQIHELADAVAQTGDDREVQRQMVEYQSELFAAATGVTGTMGECISAQNEYITSLEGEFVRLRNALAASREGATETPSPSPTAPDEEPVDLNALRQEAVDSCEAAAEAHETLQERLDDA